MKTPILLIIFNRTKESEQVFSRIKEMKPEKLFIASDGGRTPSEHSLIQFMREVLLKQIDWPCEVKTLFHGTNLGCGKGPATAISWFFEHVEEGIILEDDCVPSKEFFLFCEDNLATYRDRPGVMMISGNNFLFGKHKPQNSHYLSIYGLIWGWATWKRAWEKFSFDLPLNKTIYFPDYLSLKERTFWVEKYHIIRKGKERNNNSVWDVQWQYAMFNNSALSVSPSVNLVSNIGFSDDATHTTNRESRLFNVPTEALPSQYYEDNEIIRQNVRADIITFRHVHLKEFNLWDKIRKMIR